MKLLLLQICWKTNQKKTGTGYPEGNAVGVAPLQGLLTGIPRGHSRRRSPSLGELMAYAEGPAVGVALSLGPSFMLRRGPGRRRTSSRHLAVNRL